MLQNLMSQQKAKDMGKLADSVSRFEYDWRKYEQETGETLSEKFKAAALLNMFPDNAQTDKLKYEHQQGTVGYQQMVDQVISYSQHIRSEHAFRRGDTDAMMCDHIAYVLPINPGDFYAGYEDAYAEDGAQVTDVAALDRPLAAMYQKGLGKGRNRKGKGKGKGTGTSTSAATAPKGSGRKGKGKGKGANKICDYCHKRGHEEKDGCWAKERGEPRATGPKPQITNVESAEADWTSDEPPPSNSQNGGILRHSGSLEREVFSLEDDELMCEISEDDVLEEFVGSDVSDSCAHDMCDGMCDAVMPELEVEANDDDLDLSPLPIRERTEREWLEEMQLVRKALRKAVPSIDMLSFAELANFDDGESVDEQPDASATIVKAIPSVGDETVEATATTAIAPTSAAADVESGAPSGPWQESRDRDPWGLGRRLPQLTSQAEAKPYPEWGSSASGSWGGATSSTANAEEAFGSATAVAEPTTADTGFSFATPMSLSEELRRMNLDAEAKRVDLHRLFSGTTKFSMATPPSSITIRSASPVANSWRRPRPRKSREAAGDNNIDISVHNKLHSHENQCDMPQPVAHDFENVDFGNMEFNNSEHKDMSVHLENENASDHNHYHSSMKVRVGDGGKACEFDDFEFNDGQDIGSHIHGMQSAEVGARKEEDGHADIVSDEEVIEYSVIDDDSDVHVPDSETQEDTAEATSDNIASTHEKAADVVCEVAMHEHGQMNNQLAHSQPSDHGKSGTMSGSESEATTATAAKGPRISAPCGVHAFAASPLDLRESSGAQVLDPSKPFGALVASRSPLPGARCESAVHPTSTDEACPQEEKKEKEEKGRMGVQQATTRGRTRELGIARIVVDASLDRTQAVESSLHSSPSVDGPRANFSISAPGHHPMQNDSSNSAPGHHPKQSVAIGTQAKPSTATISTLTEISLLQTVQCLWHPHTMAATTIDISPDRIEKELARQTHDSERDDTRDPRQRPSSDDGMATVSADGTMTEPEQEIPIDDRGPGRCHLPLMSQAEAKPLEGGNVDGDHIVEPSPALLSQPADAEVGTTDDTGRPSDGPSTEETANVETEKDADEDEDELRRQSMGSPTSISTTMISIGTWIRMRRFPSQARADCSLLSINPRPRRVARTTLGGRCDETWTSAAWNQVPTCPRSLTRMTRRTCHTCRTACCPLSSDAGEPPDWKRRLCNKGPSRKRKR